MTRAARLALVSTLAILASCDARAPGASPASSSAALPPSVSGAGQPWLELFAAVRARDFAKAHAQMAAPYRAAVSVEVFRAALERNALVAQQTAATTFSYGGGRGDGGSLHAEGAVATPLGVVRFECFYVHEDGGDRLLSLLVAGVPVVGIGVLVPEPSVGRGAAAPPRRLGPAALAGSYELTKNPSMGGQLVVRSVAPFSFDLTVARKRPSAPHGELQAASATVVDEETAVFVSERDCKITLHFAGRAIVVRQEGDCTSAGFGAFVDASGTYTTRSN